jgi:hypothetical protein
MRIQLKNQSSKSDSQRERKKQKEYDDKMPIRLEKLFYKI